MHDRDELHSEPGLDIMGNVFDGGDNGVPSCEWQVYNYTKAFHLEVGLI